MSKWRPIETAPRDGTRILARKRGASGWCIRRTFWGKTSHVPLYGWNYGRDVEDLDLWNPTQWMPIVDPTGSIDAARAQAKGHAR